MGDGTIFFSSMYVSCKNDGAAEQHDLNVISPKYLNLLRVLLRPVPPAPVAEHPDTRRNLPTDAPHKPEPGASACAW